MSERNAKLLRRANWSERVNHSTLPDIVTPSGRIPWQQYAADLLNGPTAKIRGAMRKRLLKLMGPTRAQIKKQMLKELAAHP